MPIKISVVLAGQPLEIKVFDGAEPESAEQNTAASETICRTIGDLRAFITENSKFDGHSMKLIYKG